jgi:hypothetical protein
LSQKWAQEVSTQVEREKTRAAEIEAARLQEQKLELSAALAKVALANSQRDQTRAAQKIAENEPGAAAAYLLRALQTPPANEAASLSLWFLLRYGAFGTGWALDKRIETPGATRQLQLSPDGRVIARQDDTKMIVLWNREFGTLIRELERPSNALDGFLFLGPSERLLVFDNSRIWRIYDGTNRETVPSPIPDFYRFSRANVSPDNRYYLIDLPKRRVSVYDLFNGTSKFTLGKVAVPVFGPYWRRDSSAFFVVAASHQIQLRSVADGKPLSPPFGPTLQEERDLDVFGQSIMDPSGQYLSLRMKTPNGNLTSVWKLDPAPTEIWKSPAGAVVRWHAATGALTIRSQNRRVQYLDLRQSVPTLVDQPPYPSNGSLPNGIERRVVQKSGQNLTILDRLSGDNLIPPSATVFSSGVATLSEKGDHLIEGARRGAILEWSLPQTRMTRWGQPPSSKRLERLRTASREVISPKGDWTAILPVNGPLRMSKRIHSSSTITFELPLRDVAELCWLNEGESFVAVYDDGRAQHFSWKTPKRWEPALVSWIEALAGQRTTETETLEPRDFAERLAWRQRLESTELTDPAWIELRDWWLSGRPGGSDVPSYDASWVREPDPPDESKEEGHPRDPSDNQPPPPPP